MRRYSYSWQHIPSARAGFGTIWCKSRAEFTRRLRRWTQRGVWKYREA